MARIRITSRLDQPSLKVMAQRGSKPSACAKCGRNHSYICHEGSASCFKCDQTGHLMRECQKNKEGSGNGGNRSKSSLVAQPDRVAPRGVTFSTCKETNHLYALNNGREHENLLDVFTGMIQVFDFTIYALVVP